MSETILKVANVSKRFGGLQALSDVGITIERGQVYGLIGPNGAGKTTLIRILATLLEPTFGSVHIGGAQFGMADGSVRFVSENVSIIVFNAAGSKDKNEMVGEF